MKEEVWLEELLRTVLSVSPSALRGGVGALPLPGCHEVILSNTWHMRDCPTCMPFFWIFQAYSGLVA